MPCDDFARSSTVFIPRGEVQLLTQLISRDNPDPVIIHATGGPKCGKSATVRRVLQSHDGAGELLTVTALQCLTYS